MEKKFTDFSPQDAQKLAQTPAAQQLMALFQQQPEAKKSMGQSQDAGEAQAV